MAHTRVQLAQPTARESVRGGTNSLAEQSVLAADLLIRTMRELSRARSRDAVADVVKKAARELVSADGATFVLRDGTQCFYLDEDAISPLWKGQRFPMTNCVSGWVMMHGEQVAMPDIYVDPRVPYEAYRPTFVKSMVMTPVRANSPIAAIGIYWAEIHQATDAELKLLQDLADTTAVALENAYINEELEQRVADRTEQLTQANVELEAFSRMVAHDLRSPLSAIIGFADLLEAGGTSLSAEKIHTFSSAIALAGRNMNDLIGALLALAHSSRAELKRTEVDLSTLATHIAKQPHVQDLNPRAEVSVAPGLTAHADPALIEVVLTNLLSNALKYSSKSSGPRVEFGARMEADGTSVFFVRDNGAGFDAAHASRLFTPFTRLHSQREFAGHGVGLATVASIVRRHGGRIWAEAARGEGATFFFTLPGA